MSDPLIHYHLVRFCGLIRPGYMCRTLPPGLWQSSRVGLDAFDLAVSAEIFNKPPSGIAAFYSATARSVHWFGGSSNPTFWIADDLTRPDDWMSSSLCALRDIHQRLLRDYHCVLADPPAHGHSAPAANAPAAPDGSASPLQLPQLSSLAQPASSGHADGDADSTSPAS